MISSHETTRSVTDRLPRDRRQTNGRLFWKYTALFAIFFLAFYSPFLLYGKSLMRTNDGTSQYLTALLYSRQWLRAIVDNLRQGKLEIPFWSLKIGYGQSTFGNLISYRPLLFLYALFPRDKLELYLILRYAVSLYITGLSFLAYARSRVREHSALLLGSMLYIFSGFLPYMLSMHWFFVGMAFGMPLMLIGIDRIFKGKWSWLFVLIVAKEGLAGYYPLFMMTLPAVIYALFHYFELSPEKRSRCGGLVRIVLRHAVQFLAGVGLAAVSMLPNLILAFSSSRVGAQKDISLLHWSLATYLSYLRAFVDVNTIVDGGRIALPSIGLAGMAYLFYTHRRKDKLLWGQLIVYHLTFLIPALTMVFSAFAGRTQRWSYAFSFWVSLSAACMLPKLLRDDGQGLRFCRVALYVYAVVYMAVSVWTGHPVSLSLVLALLGVALLRWTLLSDGGCQRKRLAMALLFAMLLVETTTKSYEFFSPEYGNVIDSYLDAGAVLDRVSDNAADALNLVSDPGVYRTDVIGKSLLEKKYLLNYGVLEGVNGLSTYFSITDSRIVDYSLDVGNSQQQMEFKICDFDQRPALDALAGVKYATAFETGLSRIPYGYKLVDSGERTLSDGTVTTQYLYENQYALPLSYAYVAAISREEYDALPSYRREQAMLQGVVLEEDSPLPGAELTFEDEILYDNDAIMAVLAEKAKDNANLEVDGNVIRVRKENTAVNIPIEKTTGQMGVLFRNALYESVNLAAEEAQRLEEEGGSRLAVMNARRAAHQWVHFNSPLITVTTGDMSNFGMLKGIDSSYFIGQKDMLINLGYGETGKTLRIKFEQPGDYSFDSVELIRQSMEGYADRIAALQERQASSVAVDGNTVTVKYDLDESAFALLAVPYSRSWSATVDGEKTQILPANGMYMGVMLPAGEHTIVYRYALRGFREGAAVSLATLIGLVVFGIARRVRRCGR